MQGNFQTSGRGCACLEFAQRSGRSQLTYATRNEETTGELGHPLSHLVTSLQLRLGVHIVVDPRPCGIMSDVFQEALRRGDVL